MFVRISKMGWFFLLFFLSQKIVAQEYRLTIDHYIDLVREHHPELIHKRLDSQIKKTSYDEEPIIRGYGGRFIANYAQDLGDSKKNPQKINFDYGWRYKFIRGGTELYLRNKNLGNTINEADQWNAQISLTVNQPLLAKGFWDNYNQREIDTRKINYQIAETTYNQELSRYVKEALLIYWQYQINREIVDLSKDILADSKELLKFNQKRVKIGMVTKSEILTSQSQVLKSELNINSSLDHLKKIQETLKYFMGKSEELNLEIVFTDRLEIIPLEIDDGEAIETALKEREEFRAFAYRKDTYLNALEMAKHLTVLPQLDASLTYSLFGNGNTLGNAFGQIKENFGKWDGMDLSLGIHFSFQTDISFYYLSTKGREEELEKLSLEEKQFVLYLKNQIRQAIREIDYAYQQIKTYRKILNFENQKYQIGKKDYYIGKLDLAQHIQNQQSIQQAKINYLNSQFSYWQSILNFKLAEGTLLKDYGISLLRIDRVIPKNNQPTFQ